MSEELGRYEIQEEIARGADEFGVELWEHVGNVIQAMRIIGPELGFVRLNS